MIILPQNPILPLGRSNTGGRRSASVWIKACGRIPILPPLAAEAYSAVFNVCH